MKQPSLYIYHSNIFDGNIYVKAMGLGECESCMITLQRQGSDVATLKGQPVYSRIRVMVNTAPLRR